jgi:ketosteroid isomerase-like protein
MIHGLDTTSGAGSDLPAAHVTPHRQEILDTDARFFSALLEADRDSLDELLAPDFLIVDVNAGGLTSRADLLAAVDSGLVSFESIETSPEDAIVREYPAAAIVIGTTAMRFRLADGSSVRVRSRYTHVFTQSDGNWQLVSAQGTALASE